MKKVYFHLFLLLGLTTTSFAQKDTTKTDSLKTPLVSMADEYKKYLPNFSPLSPNAAAIQKYGDYQVNMATGSVDNAISLLTITEGDFSLPIVLRNQSNGHRMDDFASWVGWGWSLDFGSAVNRSIRGLVDDKPIAGNYLSNPVVARNLCDNSTDYTFINNVQNNSADLEPDLFTYSTHQVGGKFMLRPSNQSPFLIPFQPAKISYSTETNGEIKSFQVLNPDGSASVFGKTVTGEGASEYQSVFVESTAEYTSNGIVSWHLAQMLSANGSDKLSFYYQDGGEFTQTNESWSASLTFDQSGTPTSYFIQPQSNLQRKRTVQKNIKKIIFTNGKVEFEQSAGTRNDQSNSHSLNKIKVYGVENGDTVLHKSIVFRYSYFKDRLNNDARLKLDRLVFFNATETDSLVYKFDYSTNTFSYTYQGDTSPNDDWKKQDYFGFYNGQSNAHLFDIGTYSGATISGGAANRSSDETLMKEGVLSKITYPTGGFTTFDYEANRYKNSGITEIIGAGLRIKAIRNYTVIGQLATQKRYEYSSDDGLGVGKLNVVWSYPTSGKVGDLRFISGTNIHNTHYLGTNGLAEMSTFDGTQVFYTSVKEFADSLGQANGYTTYEFSHEPDIIVNIPQYLLRDIEPWKRGLLLSKKVYNSLNLLVESVVNTYQEMKKDTTTNEGKVFKINEANGSCATCTSGMSYGFTIPNGRLLNIQSPACTDPMYVYLKAQSKTGQMKLISSVSVIDGVSSTSSISYDNNLFPIKTISDDSKTNSYRQKTSIYSTHSSYNSDAIALEMRSRNMIGIPLESIEKDSISGVLTTNFHQKTVYDSFTGNNARNLTNNILTKEIWVAPTGTTLEKRVEFTNYDTDGNPTEYKVDGIPTALIWGYNGSLLLGQVQNATISAVNTALTSAGVTAGAYSLTSLSNAQLTALSAFRNALPNSLVSWQTYRPQVGMSMSISPNGLNTFFKYDNFQRLEFTKDHSDFITSKYAYEYGFPYNRVITTLPLNATTNESTYFYYGNSSISYTYSDGLGRYIQTVANGQSPTFKDIVSNHTQYDKYGRNLTKTLTTPLAINTGSIQTNLLPVAQSFYADLAPLDSLIYENSPLNRIKQSYGVGQAWRLASKKTQYFYENAGTEIPYYTIDTNTGNISQDGNYPTNSLFKRRIIDEQGNTSIEITDKRGRLVMKQVEKTAGVFNTTYFINDGLGRTLAIIQPEAFGTTNITANSAIWNNFVFFYKYDSRGRIIEKHIPNGGTTHVVYDKQDREVLNQDEHQRTDNKWSFAKYDALNRNIISGEFVNTNTRSQLQTQFDAQVIRNEQFDATKPEKWHYTDNSFPFVVDSSKANLINYYDFYTAWRPTGYDYIEYVMLPNQNYSDVKGLQTGFVKRNTENRDMLFEVNYFDNKNRLIQKRKENQLGNVHYLKFEYDFRNNTTLEERNYPYFIRPIKQYSYDLSNRKTNYTFQFLVSQPQILMARYYYDEVSRLKTKKIQPNRTYEVSDLGTDFIYRPPSTEHPNTQDIANRAIIISPGFVANAADTTTITYIAQIDTTATNGTIDALQTIDYEYN